MNLVNLKRRQVQCTVLTVFSPDLMSRRPLLESRRPESIGPRNGKTEDPRSRRNESVIGKGVAQGIPCT